MKSAEAPQAVIDAAEDWYAPHCGQWQNDRDPCEKRRTRSLRSFKRGAIGRVGEQEMLIGQRIAPPRALGAWRQRLGDYEIANLDADFKFVARVRPIEERGYLLFDLTSADALGGLHGRSAEQASRQRHLSLR